MKPASPNPFLIKQLLVAACITSAAYAADRYWDGGDISIGTDGDGVSAGGAGTWSTGVSNWDQGNALAHVAWVNANNDTAIFAGTGGAVALGTGITANGLNFITTGYTISGANTLTLAGTTPTITTATGVSASISSVVAGASLTKAGDGTLTLSGLNSYTGATEVNAGTLIMITPTDANWAMSGTGSIIANGATLRLEFQSAASTYRSNNIKATTVNSGGVLELFGTVADVDRNYINAGSVSGSGTINKTGTGSVTFFGGSNLSAFTGTINVNAGTLINNTSTWGTGTATLNVLTTLDVRAGTVSVDKLTGSGSITTSFNSSNALVVGGAGGSSTFNGVIGQSAGALTLTKIGAGTLTLAGANTYTGGLNINQGTLTYTGAGSVTGGGGAVQIASGTTLNLSGANNNQLEANGVLTIAGTLATTTTGVAHTLRGSSVVLNGGTMTSSGGNGGTAATFGAFYSGDKDLTVTANGTGNFISGNGDFGIDSANTLTLSTPLLTDALTVSTVLKNALGAGALTKSGNGTVTLSGVNAYTGATLVSAGTLLVSGALGNTAVSVGAAGTIGGDGTIGSTLAFADGAKLIFSLGQTLSVNGASVTFANFGVDDLVGLDSSVAIGTYTLIDGGATVSTTNLDNLGSGDAFVLGDGKSAYFQIGSLDLVVIPEPAAALLGSLGLLTLLRRRR